MTIDRGRLLRGLAIAAWAAFFDYLWIGDDAARYVGQRTAWVVPFGGIVLTLTAVAYLLTALTRTGDAKAPGAKDLLGAVALLAPVLIIVMIPAPSLGALAVAKKGGARAVASGNAAENRQGQALTLFDVSAASSSPEFARIRGIRAGQPVELVGFVSDRGPYGFMLARFVASCCAADAVPYTAKVRPAKGAAAPKPDTWVTVKGTLAKDGQQYVVDGTTVATVDEPSNAYLGY